MTELRWRKPMVLDVHLVKCGLRTEARGRVHLESENREEDGRMRTLRVLPKVVRHADMTDARRMEMSATATTSTTTLVMTCCWSRAQEEEE
jgi:hypothetical protein